MADVTAEQREAVRKWVEAGASLADVQRQLKEAFGLSLTYMDVRLLTLDVGARVKDKPEPKKAPEPAEAEADGAGDDAEPAAPADGPPPPAGGGAVAVTLDRLVRPGAVVSGDVTFSDGTKARWMLDQMGRLGLDGVDASYRPPADDVRAFQTQLQKLLASKGY